MMNGQKNREPCPVSMTVKNKKQTQWTDMITEIAHCLFRTPVDKVLKLEKSEEVLNFLENCSLKNSKL